MQPGQTAGANDKVTPYSESAEVTEIGRTATDTTALLYPVPGRSPRAFGNKSLWLGRYVCGPNPTFFGPQILKLDTLVAKSKIPILRLLTS